MPTLFTDDLQWLIAEQDSNSRINLLFCFWSWKQGSSGVLSTQLFAYCFLDVTDYEKLTTNPVTTLSWLMILAFTIIWNSFVLVKKVTQNNLLLIVIAFYVEILTLQHKTQNKCAITLLVIQQTLLLSTISTINQIQSFVYWKQSCSSQSNLCKNWWKLMFVTGRFQ